MDQQIQRPGGGDKRSLRTVSTRSVVTSLFAGLFLWLLVAVALGCVIITICPPTNPIAAPAWLPVGLSGTWVTFGIGVTVATASGTVPVGISLHWWNLPGTIIGAIIGLLVFRSLIRVARYL